MGRTAPHPAGYDAARQKSTAQRQNRVMTAKTMTTISSVGTSFMMR